MSGPAEHGTDLNFWQESLYAKYRKAAGIAGGFCLYFSASAKEAYCFLLKEAASVFQGPQVDIKQLGREEETQAFLKDVYAEG